jgi:hypothetical protein
LLPLLLLPPGCLFLSLCFLCSWLGFAIVLFLVLWRLGDRQKNS